MTTDEIARRQTAILLRRLLPRPNRLGFGTIYRRRILGQKDFEIIRLWLRQFDSLPASGLPEGAIDDRDDGAIA